MLHAWGSRRTTQVTTSNHVLWHCERTCDLSPGLGTCFNDLHQREPEAADASSPSALLCGDSLISFPLRAPAQ